MSRFLKILPVIFVGFLVFGAFASNVNAQSAGLKIKPAIIEEKADPGSSYSYSLEVTNISDTEKTFYFMKQNIKGLNDEGLPIFSQEGEETPYDLSAWISVPEDSITLAPNETRSVPFSINVPENASPGAHFGGIFLDFTPPKLRETGSGIGYRVGSIIYLRLSGDVIEEARIREFSTGKSIYNLPDVDFKTTVENLGNVLIRPHGLISITDMFGKQVSTVRVNDNASPIFPLSEHDFSMKWDYSDFAFGRYQAVLSLVYGDAGRKTISSVISFWVLPFKLIAVSLGSILVLVVLLLIIIKLHIRKKLKQMGILSGKDLPQGKNNTLLHKQYKPTSRLTVTIISLLIFIIIFLVVLFFLFA